MAIAMRGTGQEPPNDGHLKKGCQGIPLEIPSWDDSGSHLPMTVAARARKEFLLVEQELLPGLRVLPTLGHTAGSISLVAQTTAGPYVITADAVSCYENLAGDPARELKCLPTGIFTDLLAMWNSMALIDAQAGFQKDHVLPGHDAKVFQLSCYPTA